MTHTCSRGHKVLSCGLHVTFVALGPGIYQCRSGLCKDLPPGPAWRRTSVWRRFAAWCGRAMRAEVLARKESR